MALISPIWKNTEDFIAKKSPKIKKLAIFKRNAGHFSQFFRYHLMIIWRHVLVTNGTSRVPLLCYSSHFGPFFQVLPDDHLEKRFSDQQDFTEFILWGIQILRRNILKTGKMVIICTRMRILDTFWLFLLLEPLGLYMSVLHVKWMYSFHPFEKIRKVYLPKNLQKLNKFLFWVLCRTRFSDQ